MSERTLDRRALPRDLISTGSGPALHVIPTRQKGFCFAYPSAADAIKAEFIVIVDAVDHLVTPGPAIDFAEMAGAPSLILDDDCGHLSAFTACSGTAMTEAISEFLAKDD